MRVKKKYHQNNILKTKSSQKLIARENLKGTEK